MDAFQNLGLTAEELNEAGLTIEDLNPSDIAELGLDNGTADSKTNIRVQNESKIPQNSHISIDSEDMRDPEMMAELKDLGFSSDEELEGQGEGPEDEPMNVDEDEVLESKANLPDSREAELVSSIANLKDKALACHRSGNKEDAIVFMRRMKRLESNLMLLRGQRRGSTDQLVAAGQALGSIAANAGSTESILDSEKLSERLHEYSKRALEYKKAGRMQDAKDMLVKIRAMKEMLTQLEAGEVLKADLLPLPLSPLSDSAETQQQQQKQNGLESDRARRELEFDTLEHALEEQLKRVVEEGKEALRLKRADVAKQCMGVKGKTQRELELVRTARKKDYAVPKTKLTNRTVIKRLFYEHIGSNQLELEIKRAEGLRPPSGWKVCDSYVQYEITYPKDVVQKGCTETVHKSDDPVYNFKKLLSFPRPKRAGRMFKFVKMALTVFVPRTLFKDHQIGYLEIKLGDLLEKTHITGSFALKGARGTLYASLRLRMPLAGEHIDRKTVDDISLANFDVGPQSMVAEPPSPAHSSPSSASTSINSSSSAKLPPAGVSKEDWRDPHAVSSLVSNDVLEAELATLRTNITALQGSGKPIPPEYHRRYGLLKKQLDILVTAVQEGHLSLKQYLERLELDITRQKTLLQHLGGRPVDAKRLKQRIAIQSQELATAKENME